MLFLTRVFVPSSQSMTSGTKESSFFKAGTKSKSTLLSYANSNSLKLKAKNQNLNFLFSDLDKQLY